MKYHVGQRQNDGNRYETSYELGVGHFLIGNQHKKKLMICR